MSKNKREIIVENTPAKTTKTVAQKEAIKLSTKISELSLRTKKIVLGSMIYIGTTN